MRVSGYTTQDYLEIRSERSGGAHPNRPRLPFDTNDKIRVSWLNPSGTKKNKRMTQTPPRGDLQVKCAKKENIALCCWGMKPIFIARSSKTRNMGHLKLASRTQNKHFFFPPSLLFRLIPLAIKPIKKLRNFTAPWQGWLVMGNPEEKKNETAHVEY